MLKSPPNKSTFVFYSFSYFIKYSNTSRISHGFHTAMKWNVKEEAYCKLSMWNEFDFVLVLKSSFGDIWRFCLYGKLCNEN